MAQSPLYPCLAHQSPPPSCAASGLYNRAGFAGAEDADFSLRDVEKAMTDASRPSAVMPQPWFRAQASANAILAVLSKDTYRAAGPLERQLGPYVLPPFQRPSVWTRAQQIKLIESIWDGLPIGSYVYNQTNGNSLCDGWLLDGQQRITAILAYADDQFSVYGYRYSEISVPEQRGFRMRPIGVLITSITDEAQCREVYDRLAYGGTAHEARL